MSVKQRKQLKEIEKLRRWIIRCCYWYYVKNDPLISDRSFDMDFKELQRLEEHADINDATSPTVIIYGSLPDQYSAWAKVRAKKSDDLE